MVFPCDLLIMIARTVFYCNLFIMVLDLYLKRFLNFSSQE